MFEEIRKRLDVQEIVEELLLSLDIKEKTF